MSDDRNDQVRVLVTGSRTWTDEAAIHERLEEYRHTYGDRLVIVHGAATRGADRLTADWCHRHGVQQEPHPANWRPDGTYDRTAGVRRTTAMVDSQPTEVLAFINNSSHGATQCATYAETAGLPTRRITPSTEQGEQARTERDQKIAALQDEITEKVNELATSEGWLAMLKTAAKFHTYSLRNQLLIAEQAAKRGLTPTRVAGYRTWQNLGRQVRKGERGLPILAPVHKRRDPANDDHWPTEAAHDDAAEVDGGWYVAGFKIEHVWDISQTNGDPLPDTDPKPLTAEGNATVKRQLEDQIRTAGYTIHYDTPAGGADGVTNPATKTVTIRPDGADLHQISTLVHDPPTSACTPATETTAQTTVITRGRCTAGTKKSKPNPSPTSCSAPSATTPATTPSPTSQAGPTATSTRSAPRPKRSPPTPATSSTSFSPSTRQPQHHRGRNSRRSP